VDKSALKRIRFQAKSNSTATGNSWRNWEGETYIVETDRISNIFVPTPEESQSSMNPTWKSKLECKLSYAVGLHVVRFPLLEVEQKDSRIIEARSTEV
jgi:hypothetical protein